MFMLLGRPAAPPLRETVVGVVLTENAILAGLDSTQAESVAMLGQTILRQGAVPNCAAAIAVGNAFIDRLLLQQERHSNFGRVSMHPHQRVNNSHLTVGDVLSAAMVVHKVTR